MSDDATGGSEPPDDGAEAPPGWSTDWQNIPERRRERARREAAGASRDLASALLAGGDA